MQVGTNYLRLPREDEIIEYDFELFSWETAMDNFQASIHERQKYDFIQRGVKPVGHYDDNDKSTWNRMPTLVSQHAELIPVVSKVRKLIEDRWMIKEPDRVNCHMFVSITSNSKCFDWHDDEDETYIWQVKGKTKWYLGEDETILSPNEIIHIPKFKKHKLEIIEPRISVSFSIERKSNE